MNFDLRRIIPGAIRTPAEATLFDDEEERGNRWLSILLRALTSLVLATGLWIYVASINNPQNVQTFHNQTIEIRNIPASLRPTLGLTSVDVTVRANRSVMQSISAASIRTYIDLSGYKEGTADVPIKVDIAAGGTADAIPPSVQVRLDLLANKAVPLTARLTGTPDFGYTVRGTNVSTNTVTVSGLAADVSKVARAEVVVDIDRRNTTGGGDIAPTALDADGNPVANVTFTPDNVHVTVPIELSLNYRTVPVKFNIKGEPANGYRIESINVNPDIVTILGQPEVLSQTTFLDTEPVDVTGQTATIDTHTRLILGAGISLYNMPTNSVDVQVVIKQVQTTQILPVIVTVANARAGLDVVLATNRLDLTLAGPLSALQAMQPTDARAVLDLTGLGPGQYEIAPTVTLPEGIEAAAISPARLPVTILPAATPTSPATVLPALPSPPLTPGLEPPTFTPGASGGTPTTSPTPLPLRSATPTSTPTTAPRPPASTATPTATRPPTP
jgi:YbbR domain-containing protein